MAELSGSDVLNSDWTPTEIDTSVAHPARMYDYYLGGKDNYAADREAAEKVLAILPEGRAMALANRAFLGRAVRYLAGVGIRQFLDIGTGIPGPGSTSETAHTVAPDARIVYVDNDPIVLTHARALLAGDRPGLTTVVQADLRSPGDILDHPEVRRVLDFDEPVAVLLVAVLHFIKTDEDPAGIVERLKQHLAPGSYLVVSHGTGDFDPDRSEAAVRGYDKATAPFVLRDHKEVAGFFDGLDLVEPGVVQLPWWRPDGEVPEDSDRIWLYAGVGHKSQATS
ncbi:MAG: SAM-dependent methyltransferase [Catenulispora sp.]|nr:SAM-dependent methyltransferase [Catenulispora sp.]